MLHEWAKEMQEFLLSEESAALRQYTGKPGQEFVLLIGYDEALECWVSLILSGNKILREYQGMPSVEFELDQLYNVVTMPYWGSISRLNCKGAGVLTTRFEELKRQSQAA